MRTFYCTFDFPRGEGISQYPIAPGCSFKNTYNEQLDTASIVLNRVEEKIENLFPYDKVFVYDADDSLVCAMLIGKIRRSILRISGDRYFKYELDLVSLTKLLETRVCPNLAITPNDTNRSLLFYIQRFMLKYCPKVRKSINGQTTFEPVIKVNAAHLAKFAAIKCPEMQWNQPTLREVIHDLMLVADCIEKVEYVQGSGMSLSYIDLSSRGNEISDAIKANIYQETDENSMEDYATELVSTMKNVTQSSKEGMDDTVSVCEQIGFRNSDDTYLYEPNNLRIETTMPIYEIERVTACRFVYIHNHWKYIECDITDIVKEKREVVTLPFILYNTKWPSSETGTTINALSIPSLGKFSNTCLSYERGGRYIDGFANVTNITNWLIGLDKRYQIDHLVGAMIAKWCIDSGWTPSGYRDQTDSASGVDYQDCDMQTEISSIATDANVDGFSFRVEYKTLASLRAKVGKSFSHKTKKESADNQVNSYTDSYVFGKYESSKINRLANEDRSFSGRAKDMSEVPQIGQTYEGDVIYDVEVSNGINCLDYTAMATRQFVLQNYFTGVKSKIRSWKIVDGNEALERNEVIKLYAEFSFSKKTEIDAGLNEFVSIGGSSLLAPINLTPIALPSLLIQSINATAVKFGNDFYSIPTTTILFGRSIVSNWKCYDNFSISMHIPQYDSSGGGWKQWFYDYVDGRGECDSFRAYSLMHSDKTANGKINAWPQYPAKNLHAENFNDDVVDIRDASWALPISADLSSSALISSTWSGTKDNREILACTTQIEFCSDTEDIIFGEEFLLRQKSVSYVPYTNYNGSETENQHLDAQYGPYYDALSIEEPSTDGYQSGKYTNLPTPTATQQAIPIAGGIALSVNDGGNIVFQKRNQFGASYNGWIFAEYKNDEQVKDDLFSHDGKRYIRKDGKFIRARAFKLTLYGLSEKAIKPFNCGNAITLPATAVAITSDWSVSAEDKSIKCVFDDIPVLERPQNAYAQFAIADADGNVLIAWSGYDGNAPKAIWLNKLHDRDDRIYFADGIRVISHI